MSELPVIGAFCYEDSMVIEGLRSIIKDRDEKLKKVTHLWLTCSREVNDLYEVLEDIAGYWNRDQNEKAMADALWHIIDVTTEALPAEFQKIPE